MEFSNSNLQEKVRAATDATGRKINALHLHEHQTFRLKMFHNLDQLKLKFETENLHEVNVKTCLDVLRTQCWQNDFKDYMYWEIETYKRDLLKYLDILEKCIDKSVIKYGELM
ncbi:hypothetical protein Tco_0551421 [Tanacetum coccineum]